MSNSLIKLIDVALLPASIMVVGKFVGLVVVVNLFQLPWTLQEYPGSLLSLRPGLLAEDVIVANSYSDLGMYLIIAVGFSIVLILVTHFHDTHIHPRLLVKLANNNLMNLVKSSFDIYHTAAIWTIFIWLASGIVWLNVLVGKTYLWIGMASVIANVIFTALLLQDVYREIELSRQNLGKQQAF